MSNPATKPKPFKLGGTADFPQHAHDLTAGLAAEIGVDLCDPADGIDDPDEAEGMLRPLRILHDEAVRHGAECDGYDHEAEAPGE